MRGWVGCAGASSGSEEQARGLAPVLRSMLIRLQLVDDVLAAHTPVAAGGGEGAPEPGSTDQAPGGGSDEMLAGGGG